MNTTQKLSLTSILLASMLATGCSQQQVQEADPVIVTPPPAPTPPPIKVIPVPDPVPIVKPVPPRPSNCHHHAANAKTKSIQHCHPNPKGQHHYGNRQHQQVQQQVARPSVNVEALQRKLKAKGYYKGPIDGVVGGATRDALKSFQNNR